MGNIMTEIIIMNKISKYKLDADISNRKCDLRISVVLFFFWFAIVMPIVVGQMLGLDQIDRTDVAADIFLCGNVTFAGKMGIWFADPGGISRL